MYSQHFGLSQDPFSIAPDPRYLFMSERHREALAHLLYGVGGSGRLAGGGFVLLTGDIGTGKTTICRCFLEQIPAGCHVAYIFNPKLTVVELLQSICQEFHITVRLQDGLAPTVKDYIDALNAHLLQSHAAGHSNVLIIDEAQNLQSEVLEQLRLLTNLETNERKLLQIVLIGQPELRTMLARPELEQLAQRVIARFHLDALTPAESTHYISHRLAVAGHKGPLPFDAKSLKRVHQLARGIPRRLNLLCGRAMLGAWATGLHRVDRTVVSKAALEVFGAETSDTAKRQHSLGASALRIFMVLICAALAGFLVWHQQNAGVPAATSQAAPPIAVAKPPQPTSSALVAAPKPAPPPIEEINAVAAQFTDDIAQPWRALASLWGMPLEEGEPCALALKASVQCFRASGLTIPQLRQLGRPGVLTLYPAGETAVYAVLTGLTNQTATFKAGTAQHTVRLTALSQIWRGDFATFWHPPEGYTPGMREGQTGAAVDALAQQLARTEGVPVSDAPQRLDSALKERVRAFQRSQGIKPDGQPGPLTFMQMESAIGSQKPRLQTEP